MVILYCWMVDVASSSRVVLTYDGILQGVHDPIHRPSPLIHNHPIYFYCMLHNSKKIFHVHISNKWLPKLQTYWNAQVPCTMLQWYECDQSILTTSHKFLPTRPVPVDFHFSFTPSHINVEHRWTTYFSSSIWVFLVNFISSLRSVVLMQSPSPSWSPFPCLVLK